MHSLAKVYGSLLAKKLGPAGQKDQQERVGSEVPKTYRGSHDLRTFVGDLK